MLVTTYTCAIQRQRIYPDDSVIWAAPDAYASVVEWDGVPRELAQAVLEKFLGENQTGVAPDGFRAVVWAGDRSGEDLDGEAGALATVQFY